MEYLIGIDLGTSGTKTVLFDRLKVIASATVEYPMYQERNGWAEQDPLDWWHASCETLQSVIQQGGVDPRDIKGLGISGQMHGLVMLDKQGRVLRRSIIWCDQRTARQCEEITQRVGKERLIQITANPALTGFTASKILWVRENEPELYAQCAHILLPKDYVRYMLTGEFATEVSDASGMQLLDVPHRCWSQEVLEKLDIDPALLAKVYESPEITGAITPEAAALTGLAAGTPVVGGAGDNAAAAVGTGVVADGKAFTTIGTSGVVFAHTDNISIDPQGRVHTFCCAVPGAWHVMGVTQGAGLSLKWFRDNFCQAEKDTAAGMGVDPTSSWTKRRGSPHWRLQPADLPALSDGRADAPPGPGLPGRVLRPFGHAHQAGPAAGRDGGRDLLPAGQRGDPAGHGRGTSRDAGLRRRGHLSPVAADAGGHLQLPGKDREVQGGAGPGRGHPGGRGRGAVPLCSGGLPGHDPAEPRPGAHPGERAPVRGLLPGLQEPVPGPEGKLQAACRHRRLSGGKLKTREKTPSLGAAFFACFYLCPPACGALIL